MLSWLTVVHFLMQHVIKKGQNASSGWGTGNCCIHTIQQEDNDVILQNMYFDRFSRTVAL